MLRRLQVVVASCSFFRCTLTILLPSGGMSVANEVQGQLVGVSGCFPPPLLIF